MLKIGVFGAGHLGKIHLKNLLELGHIFALHGFYDPNPETAMEVSKELGVRSFSDLNQLMTEVDVVDIVTPTVAHYKLASQAIKLSKHVFIEKPVTQTIDEAKSLMNLSREADVKVQVGHVERFNPAFQKAVTHLVNPMFIETHRLAQFNPRGTDVSVVLDLMIHDIDIVLSTVKSGIKRISASGVAIVSDTPDIANARIEFDNGCVANLTASRMSMKNMRKSRFFLNNAYISVDFLEKNIELVRLEDVGEQQGPFDLVIDPGGNKPPKKVIYDKPDVENCNAIKEELRTFHQSIKNDLAPVVTLEDGYKALEVAYRILEKLNLTATLAENNI
jgi:predicted dehydrogenase